MVWGLIILILIGLRTESIESKWSEDRIYWFLVVQGQEILILSGSGTGNNIFSGLGIIRNSFFVIRGQKILIFRGLRTKSIDFLWSRDQKYRFFVVRGQKILIFSSLRIKIIDFLWSGDQKYWFFVVRGPKILIFHGLRGFATSRRAKSLKKQWKIMVLGGPDEGLGTNGTVRPANNLATPGVWGEGRGGGNITLVFCN